jgi:hypothetical protein
MHDNQDTLPYGETNGYETILLKRVIRVRNRSREKVAEDRRRFFKCNCMLLSIQIGFGRSPLECKPAH